MSQGCPQNIPGWGRESGVADRREDRINGYEENICKFSEVCGGIRNREYFDNHCTKGGEGCDKYESKKRRAER